MKEFMDLSEIGKQLQQLVADEVQKAIATRTQSISTENIERKRIIEEINLKPFITAKEAAYLLSCSESTIRRLVREAKEKTNPIPYTQLTDGLVVFDRIKLLNWASPHEQKFHVVKT